MGASRNEIPFVNAVEQAIREFAERFDLKVEQDSKSLGPAYYPLLCLDKISHRDEFSSILIDFFHNTKQEVMVSIKVSEPIAVTARPGFFRRLAQSWNGAQRDQLLSLPVSMTRDALIIRLEEALLAAYKCFL